MSRQLLRLSQTAIDLIALALSLAAAFFIRFDWMPPTRMFGRMLFTGPYVVVFEYLVLVAFGIHRFSWRYVGLREATKIFLASITSTGVLVAARLISGKLQYTTIYWRHGVIPEGVLAINFVFSLLAVVGVRVSRRMLGERSENLSRRSRDKPVKRTLLIGAGQAGVLVAKELASRRDLALQAVGFLDDDPRKIGTVIHGVPVLGYTSQLPEIVRKYHVQQALISVANAPGSMIRGIRQLCDEAGITAKIIPGVYEIVGGAVNLSRIRDVAIEDLLGRAPVDLDLASIASYVTGKVVLTTGAGGSIGSELCRQICRFSPSKVVLVERAENALFNIHRELVMLHPHLTIVPCIADITDSARADEIVSEFCPDIVLHAAAHKHVPMMERNPGEAVKNNLFGTKVIADSAERHGVQVFVMISTDKAVNPSSIMGATKRAAEVYVQALSQRSKTRFVTVRFGNVLGSAGSVIPIFQEQIARGGPVTVTHPEMRRYFMTIPEACQLVLQAGAMGSGGEIFILDMGEPVKIVDLARDLITLSGFRDGEDIEVVFSGIRPGEKLFEELSTDAEQASKTRHPKIFVGHIEPNTWDAVNGHLSTLREALERRDSPGILSGLKRIVPEYERATAPSSEKATEPTEPGPSEESAERSALLGRVLVH